MLIFFVKLLFIFIVCVAGGIRGHERTGSLKYRLPKNYIFSVPPTERMGSAHFNVFVKLFHVLIAPVQIYDFDVSYIRFIECYEDIQEYHVRFSVTICPHS
jgi:hypothetical protein